MASIMFSIFLIKLLTFIIKHKIIQTVVVKIILWSQTKVFTLKKERNRKEKIAGLSKMSPYHSHWRSLTQWPKGETCFDTHLPSNYI